MKVQVKVYIDEELDKQLRELINKKYSGFKRGLLSNEMEEMIRNWINAHTKSQINNINPNPKIYRIWQQVKDVLKEKGYVQQVSINELKKAISLVRGSDARTVKKWLINFRTFKLIKEIAPQIYEIV